MKFGYGIHYKYEVMVAHLFNRFYVVTKFILSTMDDVKPLPINCNGECRYLENLDDNNNEDINTHLKDLVTYCVKHIPYMAFYKIQINTCNKTAHHILKNEVDLILPKFTEGRRSKRGIFSTIISGFVGLAYEGIYSFLHNRRHKALHKAICTMTSKLDIQRNRLIHWKILW